MASIQLDLPDKVTKALGRNPERKVLEAILLELIRQQKLTVAGAGNILGLTRHQSIDWYNAHGGRYGDMSEEDVLHDFEVLTGKR